MSMLAIAIPLMEDSNLNPFLQLQRIRGDQENCVKRTKGNTCDTYVDRMRPASTHTRIIDRNYVNGRFGPSEEHAHRTREFSASAE